jgi:hypothetical protein
VHLFIIFRGVQVSQLEINIQYLQLSKTGKKQKRRTGTIIWDQTCNSCNYPKGRKINNCKRNQSSFKTYFTCDQTLEPLYRLQIGQWNPIIELVLTCWLQTITNPVHQLYIWIDASLQKFNCYFGNNHSLEAMVISHYQFIRNQDGQNVNMQKKVQHSPSICYDTQISKGKA